MKINTALILCAGYGKRLNPLTLTEPKPLLKVDKITLLENSIEQKDATIVVRPLDDSTPARAMWGTARSVINGMVVGVTTGFQEELEVNGVGYRASVNGKYLNLTLGKSHNTKIEIPEGVNVVTPKQNLISLESHDKEKLGQYVAIIRSQRPPEPYKGKGIRRKGEYVQRKEGKKG